MKYGVYTAILPPVHNPADDVLTSQSARDDYLGIFADKGWSCSGRTPTATRCTPTR